MHVIFYQYLYLSNHRCMSMYVYECGYIYIYIYIYIIYIYNPVQDSLISVNKKSFKYTLQQTSFTSTLKSGCSTNWRTDICSGYL